MVENGEAHRVTSRFRFRVAHMLLLAAIVVNGSGCGSDKLGRKQAARLIEESKYFQQPITRRIALDNTPKGGTPPNYWSSYAESLSGTVPDFETAKAMQELGYIAFSWVKNNKKDFGVNVTQEGAKDSASWLKDSSNPADRLIPVASRKLVEVTGIRPGLEDFERGTAGMLVEFTWHLAPNGIGKELTIDSQRIRRGKALFTLYDDGWRLMELDP